MKKLRLTAALLMPIVLAGCQVSRENKQMEAINSAEKKSVVRLINTDNDAVDSVNQQLWGTWQEEYDDGESLVVVFVPQNQGFILTLEESGSYIAEPFQYEVNSSYEPMHMDFVGSGGDRGKTIFEFTADGQLRLEVANVNPDNRPSNFTSGGVLFRKISNIADLQANTEGAIGQTNEARQVEARNNLGSLNRVQQAYYLENAKFGTNIQELGIGIPPETENYRYRITTEDARVAIMTASAKRSELKSYTGVVWVSQRDGQNLTYARLCETNEPSMSAPSISQTSTGLEYQCGDDSRDMNK